MNSTVIKELEKKYEDFEQMASIFSEAFLTAKVQTTEVDYTNEKGEAVTVSTKMLFDELYHHPMGRECGAGKRLLELYPDLFEMEDKVNAKRKEIESYEIKTFGFKGGQMRLIDFIHLIDQIVEFRMNKPREVDTAEPEQV